MAPDRARERLVLVVDDDPDILQTLALCLSSEGYGVLMASNGQEALDVLGRQKPACILLDLMMPVMDGYEFYARMRDIPGDHPPVIVVSAVTPRRTELPGIHATLPKPFDFTQLLHRVAAAATHGAVAN
jgi:CheY-like chemotaxis protein